MRSGMNRGLISTMVAAAMSANLGALMPTAGVQRIDPNSRKRIRQASQVQSWGRSNTNWGYSTGELIRRTEERRLARAQHVRDKGAARKLGMTLEAYHAQLERVT